MGFMSMADQRMRIAVAGSNALALMIATYIVKFTSHRIIVLSRNPQPHLANEPYQIIVVDYSSQDSLQHAVMGVDTIISTITGDAQLNLLRAAITRRVRRFAPAEFEGPLESRVPPEHLDRGRLQVRATLDQYRGHIESTVFNCGVLYERFAPGGLHSYRLNLNSNYGQEGDFIINPRNLRGEAIFVDHSGDPATLCLTAAQDAARLIVKSLDMPSWPPQYYMAGERLTIPQLILTVLRARGRAEVNNLRVYNNTLEIAHDIEQAMMSFNRNREMQLRELYVTAMGRYNFVAPPNSDLCALNPDVNMMGFESWLQHYWHTIPVQNN